MSPGARRQTLLDRVRTIALALPETEESDRLGGSPHFYVRGKIFAGCGDEQGSWGCGVKVGLELQSLMVQRDGIEVAKYVGRYGWIRVAEHALQGDAELRQLVELSYDLVSAKAPGKGRGKKGAGAARQVAKKGAKK